MAEESSRLDAFQPARPAELTDQRAGAGFAALVVEENFAVADRERLAGEHQPQAPILALELQREAARGILDDLLTHSAGGTVWFQGHGCLAFLWFFSMP